MLTAVFRGHEGFVAFAVLLTAACAAAVWHRARRRGLPRPALHALWAASAVSVVALTLWTTHGSGMSGVCTVNRDVLEPFRTVQGRLNAGLFVPFGLLGTLATRRPVVVLALGLLTSAAVETVQGAAPFVARLCDTSDLVANAAGAAAGVAAGALLVAGRSRETALPARTGRRALAATGVGAVLLGGVWLLWMSPTAVEHTVSDVPASAEQREAVETALREAFGGHYSVESASFVRGEGESGTVAAHFASGWAEVDWPERDGLRVDLIPGEVEEGHAFAVPGAPGPARTAEDAERTATGYAERYAPWALEGSRVAVERQKAEEAGDGTPGWWVTWTGRRGEVLLPKRLDVLVEPAGRLTGLVARNVEAPRLPEVTVPEERAWKAAGKHLGRGTGDAERAEPVLLAVRHEGAWRVHWLLTLREGSRTHTAAVDAATGEVHPAETWDASLGGQYQPFLP
ncbi:VanZ family protein [Streptomyces sp. S1A]|uniref:VanZ family protein n=1 Tax=Streptomyces sp. ICN903 TaxID=2964654 RepID=UPI001EDB0F05|nr:VanZ family protein [Streptomyces sp. ICN903]MCG3040330.1 VanZ family protein [Streptomyces sp. ICN903]